MGVFDKLEQQEERSGASSYIADMDDKLDVKAFRRACKQSQKSSVLLDLEDDRQISKAIGGIRNFDYRVIAMINKWSHSEHPEREMEAVNIDGKKASEYMREYGYSFMDCMVLAENAIRKNKPGVEFQMDVTGSQERFERRVNLSDPSLKYIPPSHMPKGLNSILKVVTFGFFRNRQERMENKRELELIRIAAIKREAQSRLKKEDQSQRAKELARKKEQNRAQAEKGKKLQEEYELSQQDEKHAKEGLERLDTFQKNASGKLEKLGKRRETLLEKAEGNRKKLARLEHAKENVEKWLEKNPDWKKDPDKRKAFAEMLEQVNEYHEARREHEQIGKDMARVRKTWEKISVNLGEMEGKRPRLKELYQKQLEHRLTEKDRKELDLLEKPGAVIRGEDRADRQQAPSGVHVMEQAEKTAGKEARAEKKRQEAAPQAQRGERAAGKSGPAPQAQKKAPGKNTPAMRR